MLYNRTYIGLNACLWSPHFSLPTVTSTLQAVKRGTFTADCDIGGGVSRLYVTQGIQVVMWADITHLRTYEEWEGYSSGGGKGGSGI